MRRRGIATREALLVLLFAAAVGGGMVYFSARRAPAPVAAKPVAAVAAPVPTPAEDSHFPIEEIQVVKAPPADPPPALQDSDETALDVLGALLGADRVTDMLVPEHVIERIVATIDNLPRAKIAPQILPMKPVPGRLVLAQVGEHTVLDPGNSARYAPYVRLLESVDVDAMVAQYVRLYPLFQQAYRELGYPDAYFNDRLIAVIDHLLAAPLLNTPIELTQPHVLQEFLDPELEARSAGQKLMIRLGPQYGERVKGRMRELRHALTGRMPAEQG